MQSQPYYRPPTPPRKGSGMFVPLLIGGILLSLFVCAGGGVAVWYFMFFRPLEIVETNLDVVGIEEGGDRQDKSSPAEKTSSEKLTPRRFSTPSNKSSNKSTSKSGLDDLPQDYLTRGKREIDDGATLRYRIEPNTDYGVNFWVELTPPSGGTTTTKGRTIYRLSDSDPLALLNSKPGRLEIDLEPEGGSTGTGFAIHPDGVVMTCAHVVQNAKRIFVVINDVRVPAEILAIDAPNDLAILKIAQRFDKIIPFSSDIPDLGSSCRVIGFPLSPMFGTNVKMSTGTVNGLDSPFGDPRLLIDATVNPGNSGGPVVGENGQLYGVAASILALERTQDVSFCVPVNLARDFARKARIPIDSSRDGSGMIDGRSVSNFKDAISCTFLIEVPGDSGQLQSANLYALDFQTTVTRQSGNQPPAPPTTASGKIVIDRLGKVLYTDNSPALPFYIGRASTIGFDQFPNYGEKGWNSTEVQVISIEEVKVQPSGGSDPFGIHQFQPNFRGRPNIGGPSGFPGPPNLGGPRTETVEALAIKVSQFRAQGMNSKSYQKLLSMGCVDSELQLKFNVECQGTVAFDPQTGFAKKASVNGHFRSVLGSGPSAGRISIQYGYMNEQEIAAIEAEEAERQRLAQEAAMAADRERREKQEREAAIKRQQVQEDVERKDRNVTSKLDLLDPDK